MLRNVQGWQWVVIIFAIVILVGWKRLPDVARSLGRSMRIFKSEVEQMSSDSKSAASSDTVDGEGRLDADPKASPPPARGPFTDPPDEERHEDYDADTHHADSDQRSDERRS
ncbi:MAG: Sec-independent protein translocase subunit TatA [Ornithinimicrobium sp.]